MYLMLKNTHKAKIYTRLSEGLSESAALRGYVSREASLAMYAVLIESASKADRSTVKRSYTVGARLPTLAESLPIQSNQVETSSLPRSNRKRRS